jgi:hypothetical protein
VRSIVLLWSLALFVAPWVRAQASPNTPSDPIRIVRCRATLYAGVRLNAPIAAQSQYWSQWATAEHNAAASDRAFYASGISYWPQGYGMQGSVVGGVRTVEASLLVDFVNQTPQTIRSVDFALFSRGFWVAEVVDAGQFSAGAEVAHTLQLRAFPVAGSMECVPMAVTFSDGTQVDNAMLLDLWP